MTNFIDVIALDDLTKAISAVDDGVDPRVLQSKTLWVLAALYPGITVHTTPPDRAYVYFIEQPGQPAVVSVPLMLAVALADIGYEATYVEKVPAVGEGVGSG